jgi:hypothetical protein
VLLRRATGNAHQMEHNIDAIGRYAADQAASVMLPQWRRKRGSWGTPCRSVSSNNNESMT